MRKRILFIVLLVAHMVQAQTEKQFLQAAYEAYDAGEFYEAIAYLEQALKFNRQNDKATQTIALSYYHLKDYEKARDYFEKSSGSEDYPLFNYYKANNYKLLGAYDEASQQFQAFNNAYGQNDFYKQKSQHEVASCAWAKDQPSDDKVEIYHFPKPINTGYSDFAAGFLDEKTLQLSSLQSIEKNLQSDFQSKLLFYNWEEEKASQSSLAFPNDFGDSVDIANGYYLAETQEFLFSVCATTEKGDKRCDIYLRTLKDGTWGTASPLGINTAEYTETQATASINAAGQREIYFISDRPGGEGQLDVWKAVEKETGDFDEAINLGPSINTIDNESTPYFDAKTSTLYFSSAWYYGFGGYDIFQSTYEHGTWSPVSNLGAPVNSCANDQYYIQTAQSDALFASNRAGALQLKNAACCYDIFAQRQVKEIPEDLERLADNSPDETTIDPIDGFAQSLREQVPALVYFHNDQPDPNSWATTTNLSYADCYADYIHVEGDYFDALMDNQKAAAWFATVENAYQEIQSFLETLELVLSKRTVNLRIEGYCSPLALNDYNINLAKRRIASLENHILTWNKGSLKPYYDAGNLTFTEVPFGEERAEEGISDSPEDVKYSIYAPEAAQERRVAIIAVDIE